VYSPRETTGFQGSIVLDLNDIFYFVQVVNNRGFSAAACALSIPKSTLSYRIRQLEANLGARLLNRTSRYFGLTAAGEDLYQHACTIVQLAKAAEAEVRHRTTEPSGSIRVIVETAALQFVTRGSLAHFLHRFPRVSLIVQAGGGNTDTLADNFDVQIRVHSQPLPDSTLVQRVLATVPWYLFAAPSALEKTGPITSPEQLSAQPSLHSLKGREPTPWRLRRQSVQVSNAVLPFTPRLVSDDLVVLRDAALAGLGIVALPSYVCQPEVSSGALIRVLPDWSAGESKITALVPHRQGVLPGVRAFMDHLADQLPRAIEF